MLAKIFKKPKSLIDFIEREGITPKLILLVWQSKNTHLVMRKCKKCGKPCYAVHGYCKNCQKRSKGKHYGKKFKKGSRKD